MLPLIKHKVVEIGFPPGKDFTASSVLLDHCALDYKPALRKFLFIRPGIQGKSILVVCSPGKEKMVV